MLMNPENPWPRLSEAEQDADFEQMAGDWDDDPGSDPRLFAAILALAVIGVAMLTGLVLVLSLG